MRRCAIGFDAAAAVDAWVPFSFVRVDRAGNMSKHQSATGFHFSSSGGTCPLWNVYETFANPGKVLVQLAQMPDGRNYLDGGAPRPVTASPARPSPSDLGCEMRHANRLVSGVWTSSDGVLAGDPDRFGCRVCERDNCPAAGLPRIGPRAGSRRTPLHGVAPGEGVLMTDVGLARTATAFHPAAGANWVW